MSDKVISQLLNQAGSSQVTFLECRAKGLFLVSLSTTASPYLGALVFLFRKGMNAPDVFDLRLLQCLYSPTRITRITFSWHAHTAHSPSVEPHGAGLLPWASSVSGTAKPLLAALHANNKHNESALSVCHPATLLLWRKKNGANDSLWFTAKCAHTHTLNTLTETLHHNAQLTMVVNLRLSCSWPSTLHSLLSLFQMHHESSRQRPLSVIYLLTVC